jgi:hypothetical protein
LALSRREHGQDETTKEVGVTQYEQENDLGRGGGEVDDRRWTRPGEDAAERRGSTNADDEGPLGDEGADQPWAKTSSGDVDNPDL